MNIENILKSQETYDLEGLSLKEKAIKLKEVGNNLFRQGKIFDGHTLGEDKFINSCIKYAEALKFLEEYQTQLKEEKEEINQLNLSLLLNLAICGIHLKSYDTAINSCSKALQYDANNKKAIYRRAKCYYLLYEQDKTNYNNLTNAENDIKLLNNPNKEIKKLRKNINEAIARKEKIDNKYNATFKDKLIDYKKILDNGYDFWGQNETEIHIFIEIPVIIEAKLINCKILRNAIQVSVNNETIFNDTQELVKSIEPDESIWMVETPGVLHINLRKYIPKDSTIKEIWWEKLFKNDTKTIDIKTCIDSEGVNIGDSEYIPKVEDLVKREAKKEEHLQDPNKKAFVSMINEKFPGVSIDYR